MSEAILAPGKADFKALRDGLDAAYNEIAGVLDGNYENSFPKSEYAREFADGVLKIDEKKMAKLLRIKKKAALAELKEAMIEYALGDKRGGRTALNAALCFDHPKKQAPSTKRLDDCEKLVLKKI